MEFELQTSFKNSAVAIYGGCQPYTTGPDVTTTRDDFAKLGRKIYYIT